MVQNTKLKFIYFGGGTPSTLTSDQINSILTAIESNIGSISNAEITLESHPTHMNLNYLEKIKTSGINRISTGIQSFDDDILYKIGAQHKRQDAITGIKNIKDVFEHVAIDLIYRCPDQTLSNWKNQLEQVLEIPNISHISVYSLILNNMMNLPSKKQEIKMALLCKNMLESSGYTHYASCATNCFDYARKNHECVYEKKHWQAPQCEFIGLGPGAFGYIGKYVTVNCLELDTYFDNTSQNNEIPLISCTRMSKNEEMRRYFILGVKTLTVSLFNFEEKFEISPKKIFENEFKTLEKLNLATITDDYLSLTDIGKLFVDQISSIFLVVQKTHSPS